MQISLNTEAEAVITEILQSGTYDNADDVIVDAVEALREKISLLNAELQKGVDQIASGQTVPYNLQHLKELAEERTNQGLGFRKNSAALPSSAD
jgi:Arc/MetJ-type ribon-helix-helix transcriptional regulator